MATMPSSSTPPSRTRKEAEARVAGGETVATMPPSSQPPDHTSTKAEAPVDTRRPEPTAPGSSTSDATRTTQRVRFSLDDGRSLVRSSLPAPRPVESTPRVWPDLEPERARRAHEYMRRKGDLATTLASPSATKAFTDAITSYLSLLEGYDEAAAKGGTTSVAEHRPHPTAGLWALSPLPSEDLASLPEPLDDFTQNPCCTDPSPLIGTRRGGAEVSEVSQRHSGTTVTVALVAEGRSALYGQYLHKEALSGSLRCDLKVAAPLKNAFTDSVGVRAVVDTGASWTAIRLDALLRTTGRPELASSKLKLEEADVTFTGISGKRLRCLGWTPLQVQLGELQVTTRAFVFPKMHEPMLLGMNTLHEANLCVDVGRMAMYKSPSGALPPGAVPLFVNDTAPPLPDSAGAYFTNVERSTIYLAHDGHVLATLPCSSRKRSPRKREISQKKGGANSTLAAVHSTPSKSESLSAQSQRTQREAILGLVCSEGTGEERAEWLDLIEDLTARKKFRRPEDHLATTVTLTETVFKPYETEAVHLFIQDDIPGVNRSLEIAPSEAFSASFPELSTAIKSELSTIFQSACKVGQYRFQNTSDREVVIPAGTIFGSAKGISLGDSNSFHLQHHDEWVLAQLDNPRYRFDLATLVDRAKPDAQAAMRALLSVAAATSGSVSSDEGRAEESPEPEGGTDTVVAEFEGIGASTVEFEYRESASYRDLGFSEGGNPQSRKDLEEDLGLVLDKAVDASLPDCPPVSPEGMSYLIEVCTEGGAVWSRNAKVPTPAKHPWARCEIPTGDAAPVRQKPYPIPQKYLEAVRTEIDGLLKARLIEPGFGDWASPVICIVKKDSSESDIRIKLAIDFRMVNAATIVDCALLGDQADILDSFHGKPHVSLADAAGGFYQFLIKESDRQKTGFILPSSCGGTLFQWRVAPYGLTNMPAIYSRAMQHVLRGLIDTDLGYVTDDEGKTDVDRDYLGIGSAPTWVDDITLASGGASPGRGIQGHCELLRRVFRRLILAGMTLKPSKTDLLRKELKVLGFTITRDGIAPQEDKVKAIRDIPTPDSPNKVLQFLGVVNFNRRFIPAIGHIAHPLYELLKGYKSSELKERRGNRPAPSRPFNWTSECKVAFQQIKDILASDCLQSHPDLTDPEAEFVLMTDASTKAAGAVLMQWQKRAAWEKAPEPEKAPEAGFETSVAQRIQDGYTLKTIGFYSKTFTHSQVNWAIFDKEAGSIVLALNHWHRLVAGRPITVYTDNTVAASILTNVKFPRPPRLQRWGVVLGTYLPHLRIAYRRGEDNAVADLLSRYPADLNYCPQPEDFAEVPDELFDHVLSMQFNGRRFLLSEAKATTAIRDIWAELEEGTDESPEEAESAVIASLQDETTEPQKPEHDLNALLSRATARWEAQEEDFAKERDQAALHLSHWAQYAQIFRATYGRSPVLYDLYCGGGGFGRGAARAGFEVVGFDIKPRSNAYGRQGLGRTLGNQFLRQTIRGMHYDQVDLSSAEFWDSMMTKGRAFDWPPPDVIHASPPCAPHSSLRHLPLREGKIEESQLASTVKRLKGYQSFAESPESGLNRYVPFSVENVEGARQEAETFGLPISTLCGTMFGLRVFRHRLFVTDTPLSLELRCSHEGKGVGTRGINRTGLNSKDYADDALSNMYGPYSWYQPSRGTRDDLHLAMGMEPGAMGSYREITQALPPDYGEYVACQLLARALRDNASVPLVTYTMSRLQPAFAEMMASWAQEGFRRSSGLGRHPIQRVNDRLGLEPDLASPETKLAYDREMAAWVIQSRYRRADRYDQFRVSSARHQAAVLIQRVYRRARSLSPTLLAPIEGQEEEPTEDDEADADAATGDERATPSAVVTPSASGRRRRAPLQPPEFVEDDGTPLDWEGPWQVSLNTQLRDPALRAVHESLISTNQTVTDWAPSRRRQARRHRARYCLHAGRLMAMTADGLRTVIPAQLRYELTTIAHRTLDLGGHRGVVPLHHHLSDRYYWDGMLSDCEDVVKRCEVCRVRDLTHQPHARFEAMPDPPHPFHTLYIDYKDVPGSSDNAKNYVLIIVDGLTRYLIAEAVSRKTAEETLKALVDRVFTVHSLPSILRSDNGPEFDNALAEAFAAYAGIRHIRVLPYNACANGKAESSVKRVQELLIKHCRLMENWRETLPMICFALNCAVHSSTGESPFFALHGRHPIMIPELEDPTGYRVTYSGPEFLRNLVRDLRKTWDLVRESSETIRTSVIKRGEKSRAHWADVSRADGCAGIHVGDWVLLKHGSDAHAKIRRKHGYPAYRRFRVTRIIPEAAALELDVRGVNIHPVVSVRQCKKAPEEWYLFNDGSPTSGRYDEPLTLKVARGNPHEVGGRLPGDESEDEPDTHQDHCVYPVEWILEAFRSKHRWWYRVIWLGYSQATWESHEDLETSAGATVIQWMADARERFRMKHSRRQDADETDDTDPVVNSSILNRDPEDTREDDGEEGGRTVTTPPILLMTSLIYRRKS